MFCTDIPSPVALIFSDSTPQLLYYSHLPAVFAAVLVGLLIYSRNKSLEARLLLAIAVLFSLWNLIDLVNWTNVDSRRIMLTWSVMNFVALLIAVVTLYFSYVFLEKKDVSWRVKLIVAIFLLPYLWLLPTALNISIFDLALCEAEQGLLDKYFYFLQILFLVWTAVYFIQKYFRTSAVKRMQVLYLSLGSLLFLALFFGGTFVANIMDTWEYEQYGLFGMIFFLVLLTVLVVRYQAFNVKLIGAQALVIGLILLIGSQYFFTKELINLILISVTLLLAIGFGAMLIRSVKQEINRKEELQVLTQELAQANQELKRLDAAKSEFISIASHQLRTPLTAIKGYISLVLEGSYGKVIPSVQDVLNKVYTVNNRMGQLVEDLLNISRIESGRVQYNFAEASIEPIVADVVDMFALMAKEKKLALKMKLPKKSLPKLSLDVNKIREVISNLIDNALKYTREGGVTVSVEGEENAVVVRVADTGIGVDPGDAKRLFEKFTRSSETMKLDVSGTGLGLYVGKNFVEAHGGLLSIESEGKGKGATFVIRLPLKFVSQSKG
ncbi:MAG: ATP-binding protein [Candidatus Moraniibacteriota bacterium]